MAPWTRKLHPARPLATVMLGLAVLLAGCGSATPIPTPLPPAAFEYPVKVQEGSTGNALRDATVTIEVAGQTPLDEFTDVNGLALIKVPASYVQQSGKLIVEAPGFERYTQFITLQKDLLPDEVRLAQVPATPPATATPTETATLPPATDTPTPVPTPAATPTPTPPPSTPTPVPDAVVAAAELNLRSGPGTAFDVLAALAKGDQLEVTGQSDSCAWLQVRTAAGGEGWVVQEIGNQEVTALNIACDSVPELVVPTPTPRATLPPPAPIAPAVLPAICAAATTSQQFTTAAWGAFGGGQYKEAIQCAQACIRLFESEALKQQAALTAAPPVGPPPDDATRQAIWNNWALNDVGTSYFIVGAAQQKLGDTAAARAAFQGAQRFPFARAWDNGGFFWSPAQGATDELAKLQ